MGRRRGRDEGRRQAQADDSTGIRIRRARGGQRDSAECDAGVRSRTAESRLMKHLLTLSVQFKLKDSAWISDRDNYKVLNAVTEESGIAALQKAILDVIPAEFRDKIHVAIE